MMNNIVIAGLVNAPNLGDQAIAQATENIIYNLIDNKRIRMDKLDFEVVTLNRKKLSQLLNLIKYKIQLFIYGNDKEILKRNCARIITANTKCVIFSGGGIIKYHYQTELADAIEIIIKRANAYNIPVMLSGVGVEGYDSGNVVCQKNVKMLNMPCVKVISTRDDINCLENAYVKRSGIKTSLVADPACTINQVYKIDKKPSHKIGLGIARSGLFKDNGFDIDENMMLQMYSDLYIKISKNGYEPIVYSNGLIEDHLFAEKLRKYIEREFGYNVCVAERPTTVKELCELICSFKAIVCTRLHSSIIAFSYDVPSIGIVWNTKQKMFGEIIGYPERFITYSDSIVDEIIGVLINAIDEGYRRIDKGAYTMTTKKEIANFIEKYVQTT